jgi:HK97 family phage major capsid protein
MTDTPTVTIPDELRGKDLSALGDTGFDELRGKTPDELDAFVKVLDAHLRSIHQTDEGELRDKTEDEQKAFDYGLKLRDAAMDRLDEHRNIQEVFRRKPQAVKQALTNIRYGMDESTEVRRLTNPEARDRALKILDSRDVKASLSASAMDHVERQIRRDPGLSRRIIVTENDAYRSAWMKMSTQPHPRLNEDEQRAMDAYDEYRAMSLTNGEGGYGVPVFIDPSIILTDQESGNPFLTICRQVTVNTSEWKGVSAAGVSWAFQAEAAEVTDNSPTLAQPTVPIETARGFIPYSLEVGMDYPMFADEMSRLLSEGYDELLVQKFSVGGGSASNEPTGILTALDANTNVEVVGTSDGVFQDADVYKVWKELPQKYRRRASWMMSVDVNNRIRQFGTANVYHAYTENLPAEWADTLFGKAVYESPYFPDFTGATTKENRLVVGDFSNYVIARRGGMSVELVPHIFGTTNNRPTGQRGWFAWARIGGNVVNASAFRLLQNQ